MANTALQKLMFVIGMVDQVSGPIARVTQRIKSMTDSAKQGFENIAYGGAGVLGAGVALAALVEPVREFNRAMGEVRSLGVANDVMAELEKTALRFSVQYGDSATDFVRSSYDIQSAINGLRGSELAIFTETGGILSKATKSEIGIITSYMGTMYGAFQQTANKMGKAAWVQQMAGQTALAVQIFKTNGNEMAGAFGALGASATSAGVEAAEQIAILGQLQSTMSGSEAAARYRAFLAGVGKAQESLGLQFTDSEGRMLGVVDILGKLRTKFGDTFEVAETDALQKAFGSNEAVALIQLLMQDTAGLSKNIDALGNVRGMQLARDMAASMVDPIDRMNASVQAARIALGKSLLPVLEPLINKFTSGAETISRWAQLFPNLTRWVSIGIVVVFGLVAAVAALGIITGICQVAWIGFTAIMAAGQAIFAAFAAVLYGVRLAVMLFNLALYANPLLWIVVLILGAIAAIAALIIYWDNVVAATKRFAAAIWEHVAGPLQKVLDLIQSIPAVRLFNFISEKFTADVDTSSIDKLRADVGVNSRLETAPRLAVPQGGIAQQLGGKSAGDTYHVLLQPQNPMGPQDLNSWLAMNAP